MCVSVVIPDMFCLCFTNARFFFRVPYSLQFCSNAVHEGVNYRTCDFKATTISDTFVVGGMHTHLFHYLDTEKNVPMVQPVCIATETDETHLMVFFVSNDISDVCASKNCVFFVVHTYIDSL